MVIFINNYFNLFLLLKKDFIEKKFLSIINIFILYNRIDDNFFWGFFLCGEFIIKYVICLV